MTKLTTREVEVLRLLTEGMQDQEIAHLLTLTLGTVKAYIRRTIRKLAVKNRVQLAVFACLNGLYRPNEVP